MRHLGLIYFGAVSFVLLTACGSSDQASTGAAAGSGGATTSTSTTMSGSTGGGGAGGATTSTSSSGQPGAVVINEIHYDPFKSADDKGEWIELYNPGSAAVVLDGYKLVDKGANEHIIGSLTIAPNDYIVLARSGDKSVNGGVDADYVYGDSYVLANGGDSVIQQTP